MKIRGIIETIYDTVQVTETFKRRKFVIMYWNNPEKTEYISFEFIQQRCELLNEFKKGDKVNVFFNLKGNKKQGLNGSEDIYFNNLQAWNIEKDNTQTDFYNNI